MSQANRFASVLLIGYIPERAGQLRVGPDARQGVPVTLLWTPSITFQKSKAPSYASPEFSAPVQESGEDCRPLGPGEFSVSGRPAWEENGHVRGGQHSWKKRRRGLEVRLRVG